MKTLILYSSKFGCSKEAAEYIGKKIKKSSVINFNKKQPNLKEFDLIILGSGIYFGKINRKFKAFIDNNIEDLLEKKFAIFFCCSNQESKKQKKVITKNFKGQIANNAIDIISAGGYIRPSNARWPNSLVLWLGKKKNEISKKQAPKIHYENLDKFIELISSTTIVEEDNQLRNNPVPPIKDIITKKERLNNIKKPKNTHKQISDQKQKPKNEKVQTKKTPTNTNAKPKTNNTNYNNTKNTSGANKTETKTNNKNTKQA